MYEPVFNTKDIQTPSNAIALDWNRFENSDVAEGYSFAIFHKFLFMDWAGKNIRDLTMVLDALTILIVSVLGFILFLKKK